MSRSATFVIAHIMQRAADMGEPVPLRDVLAFVKERRPRASPNAGFMSQLVELETKLTGGCTVDIEVRRFATIAYSL